MKAKISTITELNALLRQPTMHPLVTVGDLSQADLTLFCSSSFGMYCVLLLDERFGELRKCGRAVRYTAGSIFYLAPGQDMEIRLDFQNHPRGKILAFQPELLEKSGLGRDFYMFNFFQKDIDEAFDLTETEHGILLNCYANLIAELQTQPDYLSGHMLRLGIGHLLSYCKRFFERKYQDRDARSECAMQRLDELIENYLSSGMAAQKGQPTVAWCAQQFNLSPGYFGEMVKRELSVTAQEYIQNKTLAMAQSLLRNTTMTINEISEELGFAYPCHLTRMFKRKTGYTPGQYRQLQVSEME